jgi:hypothetical protein
MFWQVIFLPKNQGFFVHGRGETELSFGDIPFWSENWGFLPMADRL